MAYKKHPVHFWRLVNVLTTEWFAFFWSPTLWSSFAAAVSSVAVSSFFFFCTVIKETAERLTEHQSPCRGKKAAGSGGQVSTTVKELFHKESETWSLRLTHLEFCMEFCILKKKMRGWKKNRIIFRCRRSFVKDYFSAALCCLFQHRHTAGHSGAPSGAQYWQGYWSRSIDWLYWYLVGWLEIP